MQEPDGCDRKASGPLVPTTNSGVPWKWLSQPVHKYLMPGFGLASFAGPLQLESDDNALMLTRVQAVVFILMALSTKWLEQLWWRCWTTMGSKLATRHGGPKEEEEDFRWWCLHIPKKIESIESRETTRSIEKWKWQRKKVLDNYNICKSAYICNNDLTGKESRPAGFSESHHWDRQQVLFVSTWVNKKRPRPMNV